MTAPLHRPTRMIARSVQCLGCGQPMQETRQLARVVWQWDDGDTSDQVYLEYQCQTPDCGTTVQVETD